MARQIADSLAVALQNSRLYEEVCASREQLQKLSRHLVEVQEIERHHVARELHDEAAQGLAALMVRLRLLERDLDCSPEIVAAVDEVKEMAGEVLESLHNLAVDLRPVSLDKLGLLPALRQYADQFQQKYHIGIQIEAVGMDGLRLPPELEISLYRIMQEALTNVASHAHATNVAIILERQEAHWLAIIEDNGIGFDPADVAQSDRMGLFGMRERAESLGGRLTVESATGGGTTLYVEVPFDAYSDRG